jgi:hypothetical protein
MHPIPFLYHCLVPPPLLRGKHQQQVFLVKHVFSFQSFPFPFFVLSCSALILHPHAFNLAGLNVQHPSMYQWLHHAMAERSSKRATVLVRSMPLMHGAVNALHPLQCF